MSAVTDRQRAESQYLDIVDFVTQRPDEGLNAHAYMAWEHRNQSVEWGSGTRSAIHAAQDRFEHLALAVTLPQRPGAPSSLRTSVWLAAMVEAGGAFYRTGHAKSGAYVLDTAAHYRRKGNRGKVELVDNRWNHQPNAGLRKILVVPRPAPAAELPDPAPEPTGVKLNGVDPSPVELMEAANRAALDALRPVPVGSLTHEVLAVGDKVGDEVVLKVNRPVDGGSAIIIARIASIVPSAL